MRIVAVTQVHPEPPDMGGAQRVGPLVRALSERHDVTLLSLARREGSAPLPRNEVFPRTWDARVATRLRLRAGALAGGPPPWLAGELSGALAARLRELPADVVVCLDDYAGAYALGVRDAPVVLDKHHVMAAMTASGTPSGLLARLDPALLRRFEKKLDSRAAAVVVTSPDEADRYEALYGRRPHVVESGIDLPRPSARASLNTVGWIGSLDHPPNVEGLARFVAEGWPSLAARGYRLVIAGRGAARLPAGPGVEAVGYVADELAWRDGLAAAVVPLWRGAGVKLKTLSFLAAGLPTVTTTVGAEGIETGDAAIVEDDPAAMAGALHRVLTDRALADSLAERGRALVAERYTWDVLAPRFVRVVEEAAR